MKVAIDNNEPRRGSPASLTAITREGKERGLFHGFCDKLEVVALSELVPLKGNARTHSRKQVQKIAESMARFGVCNPVLIDDENQIIAGHGRVEAAKLLGLTALPTLRLSHLSGVEKRAYVIADNRLAELAGWDCDILARELQGLVDLNFEVELTGFDIGEINIMLTDANKSCGASADPEDEILNSMPRHPVSRPGDLWLLGAHELRCGDAADDHAYAAIDAAIRRWQSCTGKKATHAGTGQTFAAVAKERANTTPADAAPCPSVPAQRETA